MILFIDTENGSRLIDWVTIRPKRNDSADPLERFLPSDLRQDLLEITSHKETFFCQCQTTRVQQG